MKEFVTKRGGRHLFNEDFDNLQDTILGIAEFFKACGNEYIISGCEKDGDYINGGYVFLDGKIRKVERTDVSSLEPPYAICAYDVEYTREYQKGNNDVVAVDYKTTIVSAADELPSAPYIFVDYDSYGSDEFPDVRNLFWGKFCVVDSGSDTTQAADNITVGSKIGTKEFFISGKNGTISTSVKDDGTFVIKLLKPIEISRIEIAPSGMPVSFYNNNTLAYQIGTKEGVIRILLAAAKAINGDIIDATQYLIDGQDINDMYFKQSEYIDTGWQGIINTETDQPLTDFFARRILDVVYIQGTLPADFFGDNIGNGNYTSKYKIPSSIAAADGKYLPEELNFCHLHTVARVQYGRVMDGAIQTEHSIGCAVMLDSNGVFHVYQGRANGKSEDLYDCSVPVFFVGANEYTTSSGEKKGIPYGYGLDIKEYINAMRPSVSWQYGVNTDLVARNIRYSQGGAIAYNPAPGYILGDKVYSGYTVFDYYVKRKYVNDGSGDKEVASYSFSRTKAEYKLNGSNEWVEFTPQYVESYVDRKIGTTWDMTTQGGFYFRSPDLTKSCTLRLTYYCKSLDETIQLEKGIPNEPECLGCSLYEMFEDNNIYTKKLTGLYTICCETYYYQYYRSSYGSGMYYESGTRRDGIQQEIIEGGEYVEFAGQESGNLSYIRFKQAGLSATSPFTIRVRATMRYKGMPDLELVRIASLTIDPKNYISITNDGVN